MEQFAICLSISSEHAIKVGRTTHGAFVVEPTDLQFKDLTPEEREFIVNKRPVTIYTESEDWEDCVKAIKAAYQEHLKAEADREARRIAYEKEAAIRSAEFEEAARIRKERAAAEHAERVAKEEAFEAAVREWAAGHGTDGLNLAAKNGYPVIERTFKQIVAMVEKALAVTLPFIPYDDWSDCEDHSAPNEKSFKWYEKLVETCRAVAAILPPFVSLEVDPKIQRIEMSDEDGGKIAGGVAILSMRDARRAIAFSFE